MMSASYGFLFWLTHDNMSFAKLLIIFLLFKVRILILSSLIIFRFGLVLFGDYFLIFFCRLRVVIVVSALVVI